MIDKDGIIRYDHIGEGGYEETEKKIQELLKEAGHDVSRMNITEEKKVLGLASTPEIYLGYEYALPRGQNLGNDKGFQKDSITEYVLPEVRKDHVVYAVGKWRSTPEALESAGTTSLLLKYTAASVNVVADATGNSLAIEIKRNGNYLQKAYAGSDVEFNGEKSFVRIDKPQLYNLVNGAYGSYDLEVIAPKGIVVSSFTFGS